MSLAEEIDAIAAEFSGVVSVSRGSAVEFEQGYGLADRAHRIAASADTQLAMGSGAKGLTALTIGSLFDDGALTSDTTARSVLGRDLPLVAPQVTVEHLLAHRSGIGDYVDEDEPVELPLNVAVQDLDSTESYLPALDGFATKFAAGTRFSYCNSGFVVLALIAERVSGQAFRDLVADRVFQPAGMIDTGYFRSDELPGRAAIGYLENGRTARGRSHGSCASATASYANCMLTGEKVSLRAPAEGDLDALYEIAAEWATWEERSPAPPRPLARLEFAEQYKKTLASPDDDIRFVIVSGGGGVIGRCDLFHIDPLSRTAEVGVALHASARARGHGTDALRVLVRFGFDRRNLHRLHLSALASNAAGLACYRKVGFVEEGRCRQSAWVRGRYEDEIVMGLLRTDWQSDSA